MVLNVIFLAPAVWVSRTWGKKVTLSCFWTGYRHYIFSHSKHLPYSHLWNMPVCLDSVFFFIINAWSSHCFKLHIWKSRYLLSIRLPALYVIDINTYWLSTESENKSAFFGNSYNIIRCWQNNYICNTLRFILCP